MSNVNAVRELPKTNFILPINHYLMEDGEVMSRLRHPDTGSIVEMYSGGKFLCDGVEVDYITTKLDILRTFGLAFQTSVSRKLYIVDEELDHEYSITRNGVVILDTDKGMIRINRGKGTILFILDEGGDKEIYPITDDYMLVVISLLRRIC